MESLGGAALYLHSLLQLKKMPPCTAIGFRLWN
jgi:hypothetical protein